MLEPRSLSSLPGPSSAVKAVVTSTASRSYFCCGTSIVCRADCRRTKHLRRSTVSTKAFKDSEASFLKFDQRDSEILALLLPAVGSVFLDPAMQVIDTAIVGRLGAAPLGAVGLSNLVYFFCTVFFSFLLIVTTPRVANAVANGDRKQASVATANAIWVGLGCGLILGVLVYSGSSWLVLKGFAADPGVADLAIKHLKIRALATPAVVLLFVVNGAFRGFRDTKTPLFAGIAQNVVNLLLDLFLIGVCGWGVQGAATAITAAQYVGGLAMLAMLSRRSMLSLADLKHPPGVGQTIDMLKPGIPLAFCMAAVMTTVITATNLAAGLGTVVLAAHTIVKQITDFAMGMLGTFSTVSQTLIASCLGQDNKKAARGFVLRLLQIGLGFGSVLALTLFLGSSSLPNLFTSDQEVATMAQKVLPYVAFIMPLAPCSTTLEGAMLGSYKVNWVGGRTVLSAFLAFGVLKWTANANWGLLGIWVGLTSLIGCNFIGDMIRITRRDSPIAATYDFDAGLSFDQDDEEKEFLQEKEKETIQK